MLSKLLSHYWWVLLLRGTFAILFGVLALWYPGITLGSLVLYFAVFAFLDGISGVFHALFAREEGESFWVLLFQGLVGIAFGIITFQAPGITALMLLMYIGFWAIANGVLQIILAMRLRHEITGEWWMALGGLVSILFGLSMMARPGAGALAVLTIIGIWSMVTGFCLIFLAFKVRSVGGKVGAIRNKLAPA